MAKWCATGGMKGIENQPAAYQPAAAGHGLNKAAAEYVFGECC